MGVRWDDGKGKRKDLGQSVASMWGEMVKAAVKGEVVGIVDKHGNDVAVMMSKEKYEELVRAAEGDWKMGGDA